MNTSHTFHKNLIYAASTNNHAVVPIVTDKSGANHNLMPLLEVCKINNVNKMNRIYGTQIPR